MARRYTISEDIDYICDHHTGEEERGQETDSEDGLQEEVSEDEDNTEFNPDPELTDGEEIQWWWGWPCWGCCHIQVKEWEIILVFIPTWESR